VAFAVLALGACAPVYVSREAGTTAMGAAGSSTSVERRSARPQQPRSDRPARPAEDPAIEPSSELAGVLASLVWPLAVDRTSVLSSPYGVRAHPIDGAQRFHAGLDLRARGGTPVYAAADGVVTASGVYGAYGNRVIIDHGAGLQSVYGHHRENLVREGDRVRRGQVIALVGHTGNATGDHLHFELRWREGTVDPMVVLPQLGGSPLAR
jgi:murein DD-endopeptidase MepM/ murein hydrolase activator NlpD